MRMIMNPQLTMFGTIKMTWRTEGVKTRHFLSIQFFSFYKGMLMPICVGFPVSAVTFTSYEACMKFMNVNNRRQFLPK
jgi:hypothetical protein